MCDTPSQNTEDGGAKASSAGKVTPGHGAPTGVGCPSVYCCQAVSLPGLPPPPPPSDAHRQLSSCQRRRQLVGGLSFGDQDQAAKTRKSERLRTTRRRRSTWLPNESPQPMPALCTAGGPAEASVSAPAPYARKNTQVVSLSGQSPRAKAGLPPGAWRCPWPPACQSPPPRPPAGKSPSQPPAPTAAAPPAAHPPAAAAPRTRAPPDAPGTACAPPAAMPAAPTAAPPRAPDRAAGSTPRPPPSAGRASRATAS